MRWMTQAGFIACFAWIIALATANAADSAPGTQATATEIDFVRDVRPILARNCFGCHGPDEGQRKADLRLDTEAGAFAVADGHAAFVPRDLAQSEAYQRVISTDPATVMPPPDTGRQLTPEQHEILARWIQSGAVWDVHWSFKTIQSPTVPPVPSHAPAWTEWPRSPIDHFVIERLVSEGLSPSPQADSVQLIRRVSLDLTGLPATPELVARYTRDPSPANYAAIVDELLESPRYGERMARMWLDIARYADTKGYEKDLTRQIWRYRDYVIDAFNRDLPFDQFTREQLAGDLLPNPTQEQLIATAMHRNTMSNDEGGTDDEEFRIAAVKDRVDTTMQAWMGLTFGCAKCHSHKYDPISQPEYYRFYAFFNQTEDADRYDDFPTLFSPTAAQQLQLEALDRRLGELRQQLAAETPESKEAFTQWIGSIAADPAWSVLTPQTATAASGSSMTIQDDGSVLVGTGAPEKETYSVNVMLPAGRWTAVRLEALPDASHPKGSVGRAVNDGNFVLTGFRVQPVGTAEPTTAWRFARAEADFSQAHYTVAAILEETDRTKHGWAVSPQQGTRHEAMFVLAEPVTLAEPANVQIVLDHQFEFAYPGFSLGKFRLSVTGDAAPRLTHPLPAEILAIVRTPAENRSTEQQSKLWQHFANQWSGLQSVRTEIAAVEGQKTGLGIPQTPILRELPPERRRVTKRHVRGNFLDQAEELTAAVPGAFPGLPAEAPENRLGVAEWLCSSENPLTARVLANRLWAMFFGVGLVETQEEFGSQGLPPSHPALLDWMAADLMQQRWSIKSFCRRVVLSATYQQSSRVTPELLARDRDNRLLARGPRFRMEAEMVRDSLLAVSGLLSAKIGGPSVMPPQPAGIWQSTYNSEKWVTPTGEDRYRRGIYTFIKRTSPYPSMLTFDAPSRETCTLRRINTNTPLQALVLLNDPVAIEAAQALARRMVGEATGKTLRDRLTRGFELVLCRQPTADELSALDDLYSARLAAWTSDSAAAAEFAGSSPESVTQCSTAELASLVAVANVLLNLDEFLTRP